MGYTNGVAIACMRPTLALVGGCTPTTGPSRTAMVAISAVTHDKGSWQGVHFQPDSNRGRFTRRGLQSSPVNACNMRGAEVIHRFPLTEYVRHTKLTRVKSICGRRMARFTPRIDCPHRAGGLTELWRQ
jgi:hypothetical protein